jgi:hypothetical protein
VLKIARLNKYRLVDDVLGEAERVHFLLYPNQDSL